MIAHRASRRSDGRLAVRAGADRRRARRGARGARRLARRSRSAGRASSAAGAAARRGRALAGQLRAAARAGGSGRQQPGPPPESARALATDAGLRGARSSRASRTRSITAPVSSGSHARRVAHGGSRPTHGRSHLFARSRRRRLRGGRSRAAVDHTAHLGLPGFGGPAAAVLTTLARGGSPRSAACKRCLPRRTATRSATCRDAPRRFAGTTTSGSCASRRSVPSRTRRACKRSSRRALPGAQTGVRWPRAKPTPNLEHLRLRAKAESHSPRDEPGMLIYGFNHPPTFTRPNFFRQPPRPPV